VLRADQLFINFLKARGSIFSQNFFTLFDESNSAVKKDVITSLLMESELKFQLK